MVNVSNGEARQGRQLFIFSVFMVATPKVHQYPLGSLKYLLLRVLGWLTPEDLLTVLVLPKQSPYILWEEIRFP